MSIEVLEQMQQEIQSEYSLERHPFPPAWRKGDAAGLFAPKTETPSVGEFDVFVSATLAAPVSLDTRPFAEGWNLVRGKRARTIQEELDANGWHFFYLIPDARATGIARRPHLAIRKALSKLFRTAFEQGVNVLEIASLRVKTFARIHRAEITVRLRHIQESPYLFATYEEMRERMLRTSAHAGLIAVRPWHLGRQYREHKPL